MAHLKFDSIDLQLAEQDSAEMPLFEDESKSPMEMSGVSDIELDPENANYDWSF